jgi:CheY-like chemotaxis protein
LIDRQEADQERNRILVVDDEALVRLLTVDVLIDAGLQAEEAGSFQEARAKIQSRGNQLAGAIIDLGLPDRPGDELVTDVRALRANLPVILATGYADEDVRRRFAQDAFLQIITKPFDPESLVAILTKFGVRSRIAMKAK